MPFSALELRARFAPRVRDDATAYWEARNFRLRRLLEAGGWSIHDVVSSPRIRDAVREQWRLASLMEEDRAVEATIGYLEYLEAVSSGVAPDFAPRATAGPGGPLRRRPRR